MKKIILILSSPPVCFFNESKRYTDDELIIDFTYNYTLYKEAVLTPNIEGLYQITDIYERSEEEEPTEAETSQTQDSQSSQSS